eukprot:4283683-Prymnesium_polylepis.1
MASPFTLVAAGEHPTLTRSARGPRAPSPPQAPSSRCLDCQSHQSTRRHSCAPVPHAGGQQSSTPLTQFKAGPRKRPSSAEAAAYAARHAAPVWPRARCSASCRSEPERGQSTVRCASPRGFASVAHGCPA